MAQHERDIPHLPSGRGESICVFVLEQHTLGVFAQLTAILLLARVAEERRVRPFFYVTNQNLLDARHGPNWIEYFCEQLSVSQGDLSVAQSMLESDQVFRISNRFEINTLARGSSSAELQNDVGDIREASRLFRKYLRFREDIVCDADRFVKETFEREAFVGVHFRGTDKIGTEAASQEFATVGDLIESYRAGMRVFVATDSPDFLDYCQRRFGAVVTSLSRPNGLSHLTQSGRNYEKGRSAVLDCLILAKSQVLIKTPSLLSAWSKVLNVELPLVLVGEPYHAPWGETALSGPGYWPESCLHDRRPEAVVCNRIYCFAGNRSPAREETLKKGGGPCLRSLNMKTVTGARFPVLFKNGLKSIYRRLMKFHAGRYEA